MSIINTVKEELNGKRFTAVELDNKMSSFGFNGSLFDNGELFKESGSWAYGDCNVEFTVEEDNSDSLKVVLAVTDVYSI